MPQSSVHNVTFDCRDPYAQATWWAQVTGGSIGADDFPGDPAAAVRPPDGITAPVLLFERVPEAKATKNRVHLDLIPDTTREEEVARLLSLGATQVGDHRRPDGTGWVVLTDPEGNESASSAAWPNATRPSPLSERGDAFRPAGSDRSGAG